MLYLMRHGETDWNLQNKVLGRTDIPLNAQGIEQAKKAAEKLSSVRIDRIYTSHFTRTIDTGKIIAEYQQGFCKTEIKECLNEHNFGIFEGIDRSDKVYQAEKRKFFKKYQDGESYLDVAARVYPFIEQINKKKDVNTLIVTHGGICKIIVNYFENFDNEDFISFTMKNCEIRKFEL